MTDVLIAVAYFFLGAVLGTRVTAYVMDLKKWDGRDDE
jgi:hypothetical protein